MWKWYKDQSIGKTGCTITCSAGCCYLPECIRLYLWPTVWMQTLPYIKQKSEERTVMFTVTACGIFHPWSLNKRNRKRCWKQDIFRMILLLQLLKSFEKNQQFWGGDTFITESDRSSPGTWLYFTIVQTDIKAWEIYSDYQWNREGICMCS